MKNYKITISYEGCRYNGWQKQGNTRNTIQEKFENILKIMTGHCIEINASGRTDSGVHAKGQVANFKCDVDMSKEEIYAYLNHYLPKDIAVTQIEEVDERFHARLNAVSKTYEYLICAGKKPDVFNRRIMYCIDDVPNIGLMKNAAQKLVGTHDFKGFSSAGKTKKSTIRTIYAINVKEDNGLISIKINGSGFLYNMVRIISGTLLDIGLGKLDVSCMDDVLNTKKRASAGTTLPAEGLTLLDVFY